MPSPYVGHQGQIIRTPPRVPFHTGKLFIATSLFVLLYTTNPSNTLPDWWPIRLKSSNNQNYNNNNNKNSKRNGDDDFNSRSSNQQRRSGRRTKIGSFSFDFLGLEFDLFQSGSSDGGGYPSWMSSLGKKPNLTNYVVFSLERDFNGVFLGALNRRFRICRFDSDEGDICDWIVDNLCHGMETGTSRNRAFTAHRFLCYALILSIVLSACAKYTSRPPMASIDNLYHRPLYIPLSVFYHPGVDDFLLLNIIVYKSLVLLDRIVSLGAASTADAQWHFYLSLAFLAFIVGGGANLTSSAVAMRSVYGLKGFIAAMLGYQLTVSKNKVLLHVMGLHLVAADVLMGFLVISVVGLFFPFVGQVMGCYGDGPTVISWVLGAVAGSAVGSYQLERYGLWYVKLF